MVRRAVSGKFREFGAYLVKRQSDPLRVDDEGDPAQRRARIAPVPAASAPRSDQPALLVIPERGGGDAAAPRGSRNAARDERLDQSQAAPTASASDDDILIFETYPFCSCV